MCSVDNLVFGGLDGVTLDLVSPAGVVAEGADRHGDVSLLRPAEGLAIVEGFDGSELVSVFLEQLSKLVEEPATFVTGGVVPPDGVKCTLSDLDGSVDIFGCALGHASDNLASGRIDDTGIKMMSK